VVILLAVTTFWNVARDQDRAFAESSGRLVTSAVDGRSSALASVTLDYANWDDAFRHITTRWNADWVEGNFYSSSADAMVLFRVDGSIRYAWFAESLGGQTDALGGAVAAAAADIPSLNRLVRAPAPAGMVTRTSLSVGGQLVLVAVAPITPEDGVERLSRNGIGVRHDYLALVNVVTDEELAEMGAALNLDHLNFTAAPGAPVADGAVALAIIAADNRSVGRLEWRHDHPGIAAFKRQVWPVVFGLLLIGVLTVVVARVLVARNVSAMAHAEAALESSRLKSEFLTRVSHELRTPLNAIIGYAEIIEEENTAPETRADAKHIITAARHLSHLLNDIFDQSRIHANSMVIHKEVLPVAGFLAEVQGLMRRAASEAGVVLTITSKATAAYVVADHVRLRQCMLNLVGNAIKFAPRGNVTISARAEVIDGRDTIVFDITDDGIGIAKGELDNLFKPFGQANASISKEFGGTGLGLSISRDLARAMGGDITVQSEPNRGSTFSLFVPVATASALRAA
jgi:signal transduction histidine kinase